MARKASPSTKMITPSTSRKNIVCVNMRALVLSTIIGSIDRSLEAVGFTVDNLDMDPKCKATWTCDILKWEAWRDIPPWTYDFVWASPPCTQYSIASHRQNAPKLRVGGCDRGQNWKSSSI